jgi:predicted RND superfamily exporter protein
MVARLEVDKSSKVGKFLRNPFVRYPVVCLSLLLILCVACVSCLLQFRAGADPEAILEGDQRTLATYRLVEEALRNHVVVLISMECDDIFTVKNLQTMHRIGNEFLQEPGVVDVKSFTHSTMPERRGLTFGFRPYLPSPLTEKSLQQVKDFSVGHPLVRNILVSEDARNAVIAVTYDPALFSSPEECAALQSRIDSILRPHENESTRFRTISVPQVQHELTRIVSGDLKRFGAAACGFVLICMIAFFRTWRMLIYVVVMLASHLLILAGIVQVTGIKANVFSLSLIPLLVAVQLTLLAHVCHSFTGFLQQGMDPSESLAAMASQIWKSCLFASLTTAVGLVSILVSGLSYAREFGLIGAVGVLAGLFLVFGPGISLLRITHWGYRNRVRKQATGLASEIGLVQRRKRFILLVAVLVVAVGVPGLFMLKTDIRITRMLPRKSYTRRMAEDLEKIYRGRNFLKIAVDSGRPQGIVNGSFLRYVMKVQDYAEEQADVTGVYSYASIMAMMNQVWNGWKSDSYKLPGPWLLLLFDGVLKSQPMPFTHALADGEWQVNYLYVRSSDMTAGEYLDMVNRIMAFAREHKPPDVTISLGEGLHSFLQADQRIMQAQRQSAGITLAAIGLILMFLWRSPRLVLLTLAVVGAPIAVVLGLAGYAGITLNSVTFMIGAVVAGIAVDDAVHFITFWNGKRKKEPATALEQTLRVKGAPILFTSILLVGVFGCFCLTSFPPAIHFGLLAAMAFAITVCGVLFVIPACLAERTKHMEHNGDISA